MHPSSNSPRAANQQTGLSEPLATPPRQTASVSTPLLSASHTTTPALRQQTASLSPQIATHDVPAERQASQALSAQLPHPSRIEQAPAASPVEQRASHGNGNGGAVSINVAPDERLSASIRQPAPVQPESLTTRIGDRAPYVDGAAATSSLAGAVTQLASTSVASGFGAASGGLWTAGAIMAEVGNRDPARVNWIASGANALNGGAGIASGAAALTTGETQAAFGYTSAAAWGASAVTSMAHAWFDTSRNTAARGFQALSGLLNVAAAGLSAKAVHASSENDTDSAAWYGGASSVAWGLGALSAYASIRAGKTPTAVHPENNASGRSPEAALPV